MIRAARRVARPACVVLAGLAAACQPLPHPFADDRPPAALVAVPGNFDITVGAFDGQPRATAAKLPAAVASALLQHNIPASDKTWSKDNYQLDGRIEERLEQPGKSLVTVFWRLRDPRGNVVTERNDRLSAPTGDWDNGKDEQIAQLAAVGAGGLAALLTDDTPREQPGGGRIRVAVRKIAGAPGDGDTSLASSLTELLQHRDVQLVDAVKGTPDVAVDADVKVDPVKDGKQHVKIVWHVVRGAGAEVGQVAQENDIPRGQLDGAWGDIAYSVAMAAEGGIMRLVERGAPPQKRAAPAPLPDSLAAPPPALPGGGAPATPAGPPVAGNIDAPEVNLPPVDVTPSPAQMPAPLEPPNAPVLLPYRGVPVPQTR